MNPFTEDEAIEHEQKIIDLHGDFRSDIRKLLIEAHQRQSHIALGLQYFDQYLVRLSKKIKLTPKHLRRIANAGMIEIKLIGQDNVGKMKESVLRVFSENVEPEQIMEVFEQACRLKNRKNPYPSAKLIMETAKKLGAYKQRSPNEEGNKEPFIDENTENETLLNLVGATDESQKPAEPETTPSNVIKIKLPAAKKGRKLVTRLGKDDACIIAYMLEGASKKTIYKEYMRIRKNYTVEEWGEIITGIDKASNSKKAKAMKAE